MRGAARLADAGGKAVKARAVVAWIGYVLILCTFARVLPWTYAGGLLLCLAVLLFLPKPS